MISIHAPLRGRHFFPQKKVNQRNFNPRPLAGATKSSLASLPPPIFQSTPPCGGDHFATRSRTTRTIFQSTPPCGGDRICLLTRLLHPPKFQSTPPCGGDREQGVRVLRGGISIHAPLRGRRDVSITIYIDTYFNPRPLAGATHFAPGFPRFSAFQSTPPCGGDQELP